MSARENRIRAFSCPFAFPQLRRAFFEELLAERCKAQLTGFLLRHAHLIETRSEGLLSLLRRWLGTPTTLAVVSGLPVHLLPFGDGAPDPVHTAAQVAAHLLHRGVRGTFRAHWEVPARIRIGEQLTPPSTSIVVRTTNTGISVTLEGAWHFMLETVQTRGESLRGWRRLDTVCMGDASLVIWAEDTRDVCRPDPALELAPEPAARTVHTLREAIAVLRTMCPPYVGWIGETARAIMPTVAPADTSTSHSNADNPSLIHASFPSDALRTAEVLVHECSHQYFLVLQTRHRLTTFDDDTLYYSPYARAQRRIERILLAFHAFANVAIFYRACLEGGHSQSQRCEQALAGHLNHLGGLARSIEHSPGLTRAGWLLYEPLAQRIGFLD